MGLISRVSSRTYRFFDFFLQKETTPKWAKPKDEESQREDSSKSRKTKRTSKGTKLNSADAGKARLITKPGKASALSTKTSSIPPNTVWWSELLTVMSSAKWSTAACKVTLWSLPLTLTSSPGTVYLSALRTTPLTTAPVSSWPGGSSTSSIWTRSMKVRSKLTVRNTTLNRSMMVLAHSDA